MDPCCEQYANRKATTPMPTIESNDQRSGLTSPSFYRLPDVMRLTGLSRPTVYRHIAACRFPRPVHLGDRACGWAHAALQEWIKDPEGYCAPGTQAAFWPVSTNRCRKRSRWSAHACTIFALGS